MSLLESVLYLEALTPKQQQAAMEWENLVPQILSAMGVQYGGQKGEESEGSYVFGRTFKGYSFNPEDGEKIKAIVEPVLSKLGYKNFEARIGTWRDEPLWNLSANGKNKFSWLQINAKEDNVYLKLNFK